MIGTEAPESTILALDTATEACSVALWRDGRQAHRFEITPRQHANRLLPMIDEVLEELATRADELNALAWCHGPGAFTGVRIAAGVVQGIGWGLDRPVLGCSTLATVAQGAFRRTGCERALVAMDARMGEVYWGAYALDAQSGLMVSVGEDRVGPPGAVHRPADWQEWAATGTGWGAYGDTLMAGCGVAGTREPEALPDARDLLALARSGLHAGRTATALEAAPVYLRDRVTG